MTNSEVQNWVAMYEVVWRTNAAEQLDEMFSNDISYKETPWSQPIKGLSDLKTYWSEVCAKQGDFTLGSEVVAIQNSTAIVRVNVKYKTDKPSLWQDVWILTFDEKSLCNSYEGWPISKP